MTYAFGAKSLANIARVDPRLVAVAREALAISAQDFGFTEAQDRTEAQEEVEVQHGFSHTLHTHHLINDGKGSTAWEHTMPQAGYCGALDAVPWNGTAFVWDWPLIYPIAAAFRAASIKLATPITWGGAWQVLLQDIAGEDAAAMAAAHAHFQGFDGPHFELGRN